MEFIIEIAQDCDQWAEYREINEELFSEFLKEILERYPNFMKVKKVELSLLLTNNTRITSLNKDFRNKNAPTNVLSFPDLEIDFRQILEFNPALDYIYLGDIAFAFETIVKEAQEKSIPFLMHFKHLLVHSILHLLGYDHQNDEEGEIMENIEIEILEKFSISSPYLQ